MVFLMHKYSSVPLQQCFFVSKRWDNNALHNDNFGSRRDFVYSRLKLNYIHYGHEIKFIKGQLGVELQ